MLESRRLLSGTLMVITGNAALQSEEGSINVDLAGIASWLQRDRGELKAAIGLKTLGKSQIRVAKGDIAALAKVAGSSGRQIVADFKKLVRQPSDESLQNALEAARAAMWSSQSADQAKIASDLGTNAAAASSASGGATFTWIAGKNGQAIYNDPNSWDLGSVPGAQDFAVLPSVSTRASASLDVGAIQSLSLIVYEGSLNLVGAGGLVSTSPIVGFNGDAPLTGITETGGELNLSNSNAMIVHSGSSASEIGMLEQGFNADAGYWNGATGIVSSASAGDTQGLTTLGSPPSNGSSLDNQNTTAIDALVKYTYYGDANLDGTVNGADYQQIDNGFGLGLTGWQNGSFNNDGVADGSDYSLIDNTFNQINAAGSTPAPSNSGG
jgi:hypothetical protein